MEIDTLAPDCLRIRLSPEEANLYRLNGADEDAVTPQLRLFLRGLLREVDVCTDALRRAERLLAQAYPAADGSVTLYLTALTRTEAAHEPLIYRFPGADEAIAALRGLFALHCHRVYSSSLYLMGGQFYAAVRTSFDENAVAGFLSEFGEAAGHGTLSLAFLEEHAKPLLSDDAMSVIAYYFL